jgi:hypothetical protein
MSFADWHLINCASGHTRLLKLLWNGCYNNNNTTPSTTYINHSHKLPPSSKNFKNTSYYACSSFSNPLADVVTKIGDYTLQTEMGKH